MSSNSPPRPPSPATCSLSSSAGRWVLAATLLASAASFAVASAIAIALPSIQSFFGTDVSGMQWVLNANLLTLSAFLLIGGSLGDHYGRKRTFIIGMALFLAGAVASGFAPSIAVLIGCQAFQGLGAALMVPQSLAIINACFPEHERGRAIGLWAGISGGIAALGPWLGGWLVDTFGWPAVFWMTAPVIGVALLITVRFIPENRDRQKARLDWPGTLLVFIGLFGIAFGLISGPANGWGSSLVIGSLAAGLVALATFVLVDTRSDTPLVPISIFKAPLVSGANAVTLLVYFALNGVIIFTVLNLQQVQGYSATQAGLAMLPLTAVITFLAAPAGSLADRFGPRIQLVVGPLLVAVGISLLMTGGTNADYFRHFLPGLALVGLGMALVIAPITKSALSVETRFSGSASGVNNAVARTAALLAIAVLGALILAVFVSNLGDTLQSSRLTRQQQLEIMAQQDKLGGIVIPDSFDESARDVAQTAIKESFVLSFRWAMGVCASLSLLGSIISFFAIREPARPRRQQNATNSN